MLKNSIRFIRENCHRPIRIEDIAHASGCSVRWLYSVFQEHAGQSPREFLRQVRFEKSASLLGRPQPSRALTKALLPACQFGRPPVPARTGHRAVDHSLRFMMAGHHQPISIKDVTTASGLTRRGLHKAFLKHTGQTPGDFLRRLRLDVATRLLVQYDLTLGQIAHLSGFRSTNSFHVAFQRALRISPGRYRQNHWLRSPLCRLGNHQTE